MIAKKPEIFKGVFKPILLDTLEDDSILDYVFSYILTILSFLKKKGYSPERF